MIFITRLAYLGVLMGKGLIEGLNGGGGGPLVGCRLKFSYFVGSRLKSYIFVGSRLNYLIFVGCRKITARGDRLYIYTFNVLALTSVSFAITFLSQRNNTLAFGCTRGWGGGMPAPLRFSGIFSRG